MENKDLKKILKSSFNEKEFIKDTLEVIKKRVESNNKFQGVVFYNGSLFQAKPLIETLFESFKKIYYGTEETRKRGDINLHKIEKVIDEEYITRLNTTKEINLYFIYDPCSISFEHIKKELMESFYQIDLERLLKTIDKIHQ